MEWFQRLESARVDHGWSKAELARRAGVAYDNVAKYTDGKVKQPRGDTIEKLASALGLDPVWLLTGVRSEAEQWRVPLMGFIGAGSEIEPDYEQVPPEGLDQIDVPFPMPDEMIAFEVKGDSMLPMYKDGTVIVVYREQQKPLTSFYGEDAAVRTADGRRFIKTIMHGQNGTVNLFSTNASLIENVHLDWIGEIFAILPKSQLRRIDRQGGIQGRLALARGA